MEQSTTVQEIAEFLGATVCGDASAPISGLATLSDAQERDLAFLANEQYVADFEITKATAVICSPKFADKAPCTALVMENPYYGFSQVTALLASVLQPKPSAAIHDNAVIDASAVIAKTAFVGAGVVVGRGAHIADGVVIREGSSIGDNVIIGKNSYLHPRVTVYHDCQIGEDGIFHSGVVIGSDGFGFAKDDSLHWHKIHHLGRVVIGDNVEIGANTTVDRGTMGNTSIGNGVKLDNQIQIGHNVQIGDHTIMAGASGVAGSAKIGKHCLIGGRCSILGHISVADHTVLMGDSTLGRTNDKPDAFASFLPAMSATEWKRNVVRIMSLDKTIKAINKKLKKLS